MERSDDMISKDRAEHYYWGDGCDGWRLSNYEDQSIIHERMPPDTYEIRHYHNKAKQFFFILLGTMTIEVNGTEHQLKMHEGIEVLPGMPHQVFNRSDQAIEFLVISSPNTSKDRVVVTE